jgi:heptosyltransferase I
MQNILFIKTSSLGDVIHYMPALTEARAHLPDAHFAWVVEEAFAPLAKLHPAVQEVIPVATRRWRHELFSPAAWKDFSRFRKSLRTQTYDVILDAQGLVRTGVLAKLARGRRHGYDRGSIREPFASRFYDVRHSVDRAQHAIARNRALTGQALGYTPEGPVKFGLDRRQIAGAPLRPYAVCLHGTAQARKEWPEESWIALGRALEPRGIELMLPWGSAAERARSERIAAALNNARVPMRRPLDEMAEMIAGASFVVGVDTGLVHFAAALGVPLVAIFCGSEPGLTGPMGAGAMEVVGAMGATPTVEDVAAAVARVAP